MAALELTCLAYINPEGISRDCLSSIKQQILGDGSDGMADVVQFKECTLPYHDLLAMARSRADLQDAHCFFVWTKIQQIRVLSCVSRPKL